MQEIKRTVWAALCSALIIVGAYIVIPLSFSPVPIVLQNLFVFFTGLLLGAVWGALSVIIYLIMGILGLPVFAGGGGGIAHLLGPTGGYLVGFLLSVFLCGLIAAPHRYSYARRSYSAKPISRKRDFFAIPVAICAIYLTGIPWLMYRGDLPFREALAIGFVPFIIGDIIKGIFAILLVRIIRRNTVSPFA